MISADPLAQAKRLLGADPAAAARIAGGVRSPAATLLLAAAQRRLGDPAAAIRLLAPLAAAMPKAWGVQFEHGVALAADGETVAGLAALERALALNPGAMLARHARDDLRILVGAPVPPPVPDPLGDPELQRLVAALLDGRPEAAPALDAQFGLALGDVAAACLVAQVGVRIGQVEAAASLLEAALAVSPQYHAARFRLAAALHLAERDEDALEPVCAVLAALPDLRAAQALHGAILLRMGREEAAARALRPLAEAAPADPHARLVYGHALRALGKRDDALCAYRSAIAAAPGFGEAYWSIADLKTGALTPADLPVLRAQLANATPGTAERSHLGFALARACEDSGDYAAAFPLYLRANADRRAIEQYDRAAQEAFVARTIDLFDAGFLADRSGAGAACDAPIFVLGMPRAGSSLVEQILASHSAVEGVSELPFVTALARGITPYPQAIAALPAERLAALGAEYLRRVALRRRTDRPRFVDKFPGNALHIGLIRLILPGARIIDMRRDARDCCVSLFSQSFAAGQAYSYDLADLGHYYWHYVALMRHFDTVLPGAVLRVDYERLVDDPERETRRLLDHCGLAFEPQCLRFFENARPVRTASSEQVRQPIYRGSIGRWQRFEPWLGPLFAALA